MTCDNSITSHPFECSPINPIRDGIKIIPNDILCINHVRGQVRFPRSKKKRIRNKWAKDSKNYGLVERHQMVHLKGENVIFLSQKMHDKMIKQFNP